MQVKEVPLQNTASVLFSQDPTVLLSLQNSFSLECTRNAGCVGYFRRLRPLGL